MQEENDAILPGTPIKKLDPFDLRIKLGDKVLDRSTGEVGTIDDIRETGADWVEIILKFKGTEYKAYQRPHAVYLGLKHKE